MSLRSEICQHYKRGTPEKGHLVVAVLLVTVGYQAVLSPPSGLWQDNGLCNTTEVGSSPNETTDMSNTTLPKTKAGFIMPNTDNKT